MEQTTTTLTSMKTTTTTTTTTTASSPSILAVVEWDHENTLNESHNKMRLENGSLRHLVERIRQELLVDKHDDNIVKEVVGALFFEISIYDSKTNDHQILCRGEMGRMDQDSLIALDPTIPLQQQQQGQVEQDEDLTQRFGRRWRLRVVSMKEKRHEQKQEQQPLLAIQGRSYHENVVIAGKTLYIQERWNDQSNQTAFTVWDASLVLARYLEENQSLMLRGKNVLELGAGCGLAGMAAACCGAEHVILTDRQEIVPHLQANVDANLRALWVQDFDSTTIKSSLPITGTATCQTLDWFQPSTSSSLAWRNGGNVDVILVADCVWTVDLVEPLLNTLQVLTEPPLDTQVTQSQSEIYAYQQVISLNDGKNEILHNVNNQNSILVLIAYQRRGLATHQAFWKGLHHLFQVETLPSPSQSPLLLLNEPEISPHTVVCGSRIALLKCKRKC